MTPIDSPTDRARVRAKIARIVIDFCALNRTFFAEDLALHVQREVICAPDSPGRILRDLRKRGVVQYRITSRSKSQYEVIKK